MVERFIPGRELTIAVMGDRPLGVTEIGTSRTFYDYEAKYAPGGSKHTIPADVPDDVAEDRKSTRLNSSHSQQSRMPSSA